MTKIGDYNKIASDRNVFNQIVYTPMSEALQLLGERRKNKELLDKVDKILKGDIPEFFKKRDNCAVLGRHIATPNHENRMFIKIAKEYNLYPIFFEYYDDKFTPSSNSFKHSLGQLQVQHTKGTDKKGNPDLEKFTIVDFNLYSGKKIRDVKTLWEEPLVTFHKKLFSTENYTIKDYDAYDGSDWYKNNGGQALKYYTNFFLLFTCYGILFENFLTSNDENGKFTKEIVLPALEEVMNLTGMKPLITPIGPLEIEEDGIWFHHSPKVKAMIPKNKYIYE